MKKRLFFISVILSTVLASCQYKDFDDYAGTVGVTIVADYSRSGCAVTPAVTRAIFYPTGGSSQPFVYDVYDSLSVDLPTVGFNVFAYNNDSEINRTRGYAYREGNPVIFTDTADRRGIFKTSDLDHTIYYDYPDVTYAYYGSATISGMPGTASSAANKVVLSMKKVTRDITLIVRGMRHTSYIKSLRVSVDGIQRDYCPSSSYLHTYVPIVADGSVTADSLVSRFHLFGVGYVGHTLTLHIDGGNFHKVLQFDVTDQVNDQRFGMRPITVVVTTDYDIKDDVPVNSAFDVGVDDWVEEDIPVDLR